MPYITEAGGKSGSKRHYFFVLAWYKVLDYGQRIGHGIERLNLWTTRALRFAVLPLRFRFLYMRGITQHYRTKITGCGGCEHFSAKSELF
jgi:hypothetical protein